jgi:hypothetical protein
VAYVFVVRLQVNLAAFYTRKDMEMALTDSQISAIVGGAIGLVGTVLGFLGAELQAYLSKRRRLKGVLHMLSHEVSINRHALDSWRSGSELPVRTNYLWESLRGEAAGLLNQEQVVALSDFYYAQACLYKKQAQKQAPTDNDVRALIDTGDAALQCLDASG